MERFRRIIFFASHNAPCKKMLAEVLDLAITNQASVTLLDVVRPVATSINLFRSQIASESLQSGLVEERRKVLLDLARENLECGVDIDVHIAVGKPLVEIVRFVDQKQADLLVQPSSTDDLTSRFFGNLAKSCIRHVPCAVWTLYCDAYSGYRNVMAAIDLEDVDAVHAALNESVVRHAVTLALRGNVPLHIVTIWDFWMENAVRHHAGNESIDAILSARRCAMEEELQSLLDRLHVYDAIDKAQVHLHALRGVPATSLHSLAQTLDIELLVMGTVCRKGLSGLLIGNTAEQMIDQSHYSMLTLKPDGFVSALLKNDAEGDSPEASNPLSIN